MSEQTAERTIGSLAAALAAFQGEMPTVPKSQTAKIPGKDGKQGYAYKYAGLADVTEAAMPLLSKHGLAFSALPGNGVLTGMLLHESGETLTASLPISGSTPQQIGSSLTYMRRYLFGCMTGLVTDEDEDGHIASTERRARPARPASVPSSPDPSAPMTAKTRAAMFAEFGKNPKLHDDKDAQLRAVNYIVNRPEPVTSRGALTEAEARMVTDVLKSHRVEDAPEPEVAP